MLPLLLSGTQGVDLDWIVAIHGNTFADAGNRNSGKVGSKGHLSGSRPWKHADTCIASGIPGLEDAEAQEDFPAGDDDAQADEDNDDPRQSIHLIVRNVFR